MLSAQLTGGSVIGLLERREQIELLLAQVPGPEVHLVDVDDAALEPLWQLQRLVDEAEGIGHVRRSKILAHKRPRLVPIRDQYVLAAMELSINAELTVPLRDALRAAPDITVRLSELAGVAAQTASVTVSELRALDVVLWMRQWGDAQVSD